jgi:hypothetical protein
MLLLSESIQPLFGDRERLPNRFAAAVVVCSRCKRLDIHTLHKGFPGYDPRSMAILLELRYGKVVIFGSLKCEAGNCGMPLPLIAVWSPSTTAKEWKADIETWRWENLRCPQGHPIPRQQPLQNL